MTTTRSLDVIIFGATGFTGKWTVFEACSVLEGLCWGVAGRNKEKVENVLKEIGGKVNKNLSAVPIILADVADGISLENMVAKCHVLVNCCGPYRIYGEPVVRACIEAGTHHVDVSGETEYMEHMQLKYDKLALEKNVYIISACGFESIPAEMGLIHLEENFNGVVNSMEIFQKFWVVGHEKYKGAKMHTGTWESAVHSVANVAKLREIRRQLFSNVLPQVEPKLKRPSILCRTNVVNGMCVGFPVPDLDVIARSQRYLYELNKKRPVQVNCFLNFQSRLAGIGFILFAVLFSIMAYFACGRRLLIKYPKMFSFGYFSHEGPTEEYMRAVRFELYMKGQGWSETGTIQNPPDKTMIIKVTGSNPVYGATCVSLLCAAVTIIQEHNKMPSNGGVLPPGAAFANTSLIQLLQKYKHGLVFDVHQINEINCV